MAPLPKRRHSTRRGGKRQAAIKLRLHHVMVCPNCGKQKLSHQVCASCGYYGGRPLVAKKEKRKKESAK